MSVKRWNLFISRGSITSKLYTVQLSRLYVFTDVYMSFVFFFPCLSWWAPHVWFFADISVSLLAVVVSFCGLALLVVSLFVFWKLCWPCWRSKPLTSNPSNIPQSNSNAPTEVFETNEKKEIKENGKPSAKILEAAIKISHTSPDIPAEVQNALKEHLIKHARMQRQITEPTSSSR